jgi:prevent-host-death family protein
MQYMTTESAKTELENIVENVSQFSEPVTIVSNNNKSIVLLSMEEWAGIQETLYLQSIPGMTESIKAAATEPLKDGVEAAKVKWDV